MLLALALFLADVMLLRRYKMHSTVCLSRNKNIESLVDLLDIFRTRDKRYIILYTLFN